MKLSLPEKLIVLLCAGAALGTLLLKSSFYQIAPEEFKDQVLTPPNDESSKQHIILHYHDRRPYHLTFKDNVHGLVADPVRRAFELAKIPFSWRETPAKRQLSILAENKDNSCAAGWFKTDERMSYAQYSLSVYQDKPIVAVTRNDTTLRNRSGTLEEVFYDNKHLLLVKSGYSYGPFIDDLIQKYAPWKISTTVNNRGMLQMIQNNRADYTFMAEEEAIDLLFFSGVNKDSFNLVYFSDIPAGNKRYVLCSKRIKKETLDRLNNAINSLSTAGE